MDSKPSRFNLQSNCFESIIPCFRGEHHGIIWAVPESCGSVVTFLWHHCVRFSPTCTLWTMNPSHPPHPFITGDTQHVVRMCKLSKPCENTWRDWRHRRRDHGLKRGRRRKKSFALKEHLWALLNRQNEYLSQQNGEGLPDFFFLLFLRKMISSVIFKYLDTF